MKIYIYIRFLRFVSRFAVNRLQIDASFVLLFRHIDFATFFFYILVLVLHLSYRILEK